MLEKKSKTGWLNRGVLLIALYKQQQWDELDRAMQLFSGHHKIQEQVLQLQSAISTHGVKGGRKMGYMW